MKKHIIYLILLASFLISCKTQEKNEKAILEFSSDKDIEKIYIDQVSFKDSIVLNKLSCKLKEYKKFYNIVFKIDNSDMKSISVYTTPKESVGIFVKGDDISFSGKYQKENEFLKEYDKVFSNSLLQNYTAHKRKEKEFLTFLDSMSLGASELLAKHKSTLDPKFVKLIKKDILYNIVNEKNDHETYHKYLTKKKEYKLSDSFKDYKKTTPLEDEEALYLNSFIKYALKEVESDNISETFENINKLKSSKIKLTLKEITLNSKMGYMGINEQIKKLYEEYINTSGAKVDRLKKLYAKKLSIAQGNTAPNFKGYDVTGKEISLSDFKGKLVYVDIWATWCGPCKIEIPHLIKLEKEYHKNKNVVFMSVSLDADSDEDKWKKMIKDKGLEGVQLRAKGEWDSDIVKNYDVRGIPTFLLIDKNGKIISSQAPRPSSKDKIKELINKNI